MKTFSFALVLTGLAVAQGPDYTTISGSLRANQAVAKTNLVKAAEKMPEDLYNFAPTPDVRSFGALIGHVADANNTFCSGAAGEASPNPGIEKSKKTKSELVAAIKAAFDYCDKVYGALTDQSAGQIVKFRNTDRTRAWLLTFNSQHSYEHYGNIVTYMRLKNLVPPSSEKK
jgi:uncharacterized damage-inducible protein DinB